MWSPKSHHFFINPPSNRRSSTAKHLFFRNNSDRSRRLKCERRGQCALALSVCVYCEWFTMERMPKDTFVFCVVFFEAWLTPLTFLRNQFSLWNTIFFVQTGVFLKKTNCSYWMHNVRLDFGQISEKKCIFDQPKPNLMRWKPQIRSS